MKEKYKKIILVAVMAISLFGAVFTAAHANVGMSKKMTMIENKIEHKQEQTEEKERPEIQEEQMAEKKMEKGNKAELETETENKGKAEAELETETEAESKGSKTRTSKIEKSGEKTVERKQGASREMMNKNHRGSGSSVTIVLLSIVFALSLTYYFMNYEVEKLDAETEEETNTEIE